MIITSKTYDALKWIAQYFLPGIATLYFALSNIWGFPYGDQISGTLMAIDSFLGLLLGLSNMAFRSSSRKTMNTVPVLSNRFEINQNGISIQLSNETYDTLMWVAQYLLPAAGTFAFALSGIWNFQYGEQLIGTIAALDTFLGVILGFSNARYKKQVIKRI